MSMITFNNLAGKRPDMNKSLKKWMKWIQLFAVTVLCIGFAGNSAIVKAETEDNKIADGVYIGNVYVGGMTADEAKAAVSAYAQTSSGAICRTDMCLITSATD